MRITFCCLLGMLMLSGCHPRNSDEIHIIVDFGHYPAFEDARDCEHDVDWFDHNMLDDSQCTQAFAAEELQAHLRRITQDKIRFVISRPGATGISGDRIIIADQSHMSAQLQPTLQALLKGVELQPQGYLINSSRTGDNATVVILGADRAGALYGVYDFLETLGVRWYGPGAENEELPRLESLVIPQMRKVEQPAFLTRGFWARDDRGDTDFFNWMARNRINLWSYAEPDRAALKKRAIRFLTGGHQVQQRFLNPDTAYPYQHAKFSTPDHAGRAPDPYPYSSQYAGDINRDGVLSYREAHPEWYGLIDGQRNFDVKFKYGTNFCTSNPHAVNELSRNFIEDLAGGEWSQADMINFWPSDVGRWCECEQCKALGTPTDRMLLLLHQVRQAINQALAEGRLHRNIILTAPAYLETRRPPTRPLPEGFDYASNIMTFFPIERCYAHAFNDTSCTDINHHHNTDLMSWMTEQDRYYEGTLFLGEYYNISLLASLPMVFTRVMSEDLPYYYRSGIRHLHYMHAETINWGTMLLINYPFARLLWDPNTDMDALLDELYRRYYGEQAAHLIGPFYQHLELAMSSMKTIRWAGESLDHSYSLDQRLNRDEPILFSSPHLQYQPHKSAENDGRDIVEMLADIKQARRLLDQALALDTDDKYIKRLRQVERRFAYGEAMVYFYDYLIQTHLAHHANRPDQAQEAFRKLEVYAHKLKAMTDIIQVVGGTLKAGDGFTATFNTDSFARYEKIYGGK